MTQKVFLLLQPPFYHLYYEVSSLSAMVMEVRCIEKGKRTIILRSDRSLRGVTAFLQHSSSNFVQKTQFEEKCEFLSKVKHASVFHTFIFHVQNRCIGLKQKFRSVRNLKFKQLCNFVKNEPNLNLINKRC